MHDMLRPGLLADPVDALLADVAVKIQLSRSNYERAKERYETIQRWLERDGSPLKGEIVLFYPQGSVSIGATITTKTDADQYDIDLMVEALWPPGTTARTMLDLLHVAVKGEPGSRYYNMTHRMTRCVQVRFADMHIDLTPSALVPQRNHRTSLIAHSKLETNDHRVILANPAGFSEWFLEATPVEEELAKSFAARAAEAVDLPDQDPVYRKSKPLLSLQLFKRFRNLRYETRDMRMPPSVLLSYLFALHAKSAATLAEELEHQARALHAVLKAKSSMGLLIEYSNPRCPEDKFTDRWPANVVDQRVLCDDLEHFIAQMQKLRGQTSLEEKRKILRDLFGESVAERAFETFSKRLAEQKQANTLTHALGTGAIGLAASKPAAAAGPYRTTRPHTFFGD